MTETQQRFLRAIAERVAKDQVVEVHLFPAIRQGGVETGVAVVAERHRLADIAVESNGHVEQPSDEAIAVAEPALVGDVPEPEPVGDVPEPEPVEAAPADRIVIEDVLVDGPPVAETRASIVRLTVHMARYRLTLKGVDRGKWEVEVVAEADAPLAAVDAVVRGVQRRAGEGAEPDRLTAEAFLDALVAPLATLER